MARKRKKTVEQLRREARDKAAQKQRYGHDAGSDDEPNRHQLKSEITDLVHELVSNGDRKTERALKTEMAARVRKLDDGDRFNQGTYLANQVVSGALDIQGLYHYSRVVEDVINDETREMADGSNKWSKLGLSSNIRRINDVLGKAGKVARLQGDALSEVVEELGFAELNVDLAEEGGKDKTFYIFFPGDDGSFAERVNKRVSEAAEHFQTEAKKAIKTAEESENEDSWGELWDKADSQIASAWAMLTYLTSDSKSGKKGKSEARKTILALTENADPDLAFAMVTDLMRDRYSSEEEWEAAKEAAFEVAGSDSRLRSKVNKLVAGRKKAQARRKARREARNAEADSEDTEVEETEVSEDLQADLEKAKAATEAAEAERAKRIEKAKEAEAEEE